MSIYLDNAATTRVCPEAAEAAMEAMTDLYGNPGAVYRLGREAAKRLGAARQTVSGALGCAAEELYFTSGGSEGDSWAILKGAAYAARRGGRRHVISSAAEHSAVLRSLDELEHQGFIITRLKPDQHGVISPTAVLNALREDTGFISLMLVNNETGAVTDVAGITKAVRERSRDVLIHTDAVQAFLKVPFTAGRLGVDLLTVSGHKVHAPKGVGALYIRAGVNLPPLILGGGQERGRRAGTEATPLIFAFAAAVDAAAPAEDAARMRALLSAAAARLGAENPELRILSDPEHGAPQILSISLPGWRSETLMNFLEAREICVSRSSACKKGERSYVLEAMGLAPEVIDGALRVSISRLTTEAEMDSFCAALKAAREQIRPSVRRR